MSTRSHEQHFDRSDIERSAGRRRWFEQIVMLPVAVGMLSASAGLMAHDVLHQVFGIVPSFSDTLVIVSAALAFGAFLSALIRWRRR